MNDRDLIQELRRTARPDALRCLGCGYEHSCNIHGCAIIKQAAERLEQLTMAEPSNEQLTMAELLDMDGEPVWNDTMKHWMLVDLQWEYGPRAVRVGDRWRDLEDRYYRHRPEEVTA